MKLITRTNNYKNMRHLLNLKSYSGNEIDEIIKKSQDIKKNPEDYRKILNEKTLIMLFQKTSTRTRLSFEAGMTQLGGHAIFFDWRTSQFQIAEYEDEIKATMKFGDFLMFRPMKFKSLEKAAEVGNIPVINACCEKYHPCQALSDALTMIEKSEDLSLRGKKVVYIGIANNVSNSLALIVTKMGGKMIMVTPEIDKSARDEELLDIFKNSSNYEETNDYKQAIKEADFIHTDTWVNMEFFDSEKHEIKEGFREEFKRREEIFGPMQISASIIKETGSKAKIMHCMPCHIGYEITRNAVDHPQSIIFDQAENRLHAQKGLLAWLWENK